MSNIDHYHKRVSFNNFSPCFIENDSFTTNANSYFKASSLATSPTLNNSYSQTLSKKKTNPSAINLKPILKNKDEVSPISDVTQNSSNSNSGLNPPSAFRQRKKSLVEMTDEEILQLDSQFSTKAVEIDQFRFENEFSSLPISATSSKLAKKIAQGHTKSGYPTKPIITSNAFCLNFKHEEYIPEISNNKFYLVLISSKTASLNSVDYYLKEKAKDGDTVVICSSIQDDETDLNDYLSHLVDLILNMFSRYDPNLKLMINFEFFKNINYLKDLLNLYNPSLIIVGSDFKQRRSSSILSSKAFIPIVYVNKDYSNEPADTNKVNDDDDTPKQHSLESPGGVAFKLPFTTPTITIETPPPNTHPSTPIPIPIQNKNKGSITSTIYSSNTSSSTTSLDSLNSFKKLRTNETSVSVLFEKLNDLPNIEDQGNTIATEMAASKPIAKVKSLLGDLPTPTKTLSPPSAFGLKSNSLPSTDKQRPKSGMTSIPGMMLPVPSSGNTNSNSIIEQYNRRMSTQSGGSVSSESRKKNLTGASFSSASSTGIPNKIESTKKATFGSISSPKVSSSTISSEPKSSTASSGSSGSGGSVGGGGGFLKKFMKRK